MSQGASADCDGCGKREAERSAKRAAALTRMQQRSGAACRSHVSNDTNEITVSTYTNDSTKCAQDHFVQIVVPSKIVETLESWDDALSNLYGQAVFAAGVVVAAAGQEGFDQPEGERLPFFQRVAGRAAPEKAHLQPVG